MLDKLREQETAIWRLFNKNITTNLLLRKLLHWRRFHWLIMIHKRPTTEPYKHNLNNRMEKTQHAWNRTTKPNIWTLKPKCWKIAEILEHYTMEELQMNNCRVFSKVRSLLLWVNMHSIIWHWRLCTTSVKKYKDPLDYYFSDLNDPLEIISMAIKEVTNADLLKWNKLAICVFHLTCQKTEVNKTR